ncbi:MAG TPA: ethylbenzene dehydrogenase-related protein [Candidatus Methylomirabilis sp.]|nr:ethylbenzene dehydrogenase-related protein [Candidatus Methylomirabilis sp.]
MSHQRSTWLVAVAFAGAGLCALGFPAITVPQQNGLEAKRVATGPALDGLREPVYEQATPLTIKVSGGRNLPGGSTQVTLRALYDSRNIYFLAQWNDPTRSERRFPIQKQADGSWRRLADPSDRGGDDNLYYEDKLAMIWAIKSPTFERLGCFAGCHLGEGKPYGNKYLPPGELADIWHWKSVRTGSVGQIDDQYLDDTRYDREKAPDAGRKSDPKESGGYADNNLVNGKPQWVPPGNKPAPPYWILDSAKVAFEDGNYQAGDEVPGIIVAPFTGDRGDISSRSKWVDGVWTLEWTRRLTTGSPTDVQFDDLNRTYAFGIAVFDNSQVRHAFHQGAVRLTFER